VQRTFISRRVVQSVGEICISEDVLMFPFTELELCRAGPFLGLCELRRE
jgi:hypothetical protein